LRLLDDMGIKQNFVVMALRYTYRDRSGKPGDDGVAVIQNDWKPF
jgi:hypothetical protein